MFFFLLINYLVCLSLHPSPCILLIWISSGKVPTTYNLYKKSKWAANRTRIRFPSLQGRCITIYALAAFEFNVLQRWIFFCWPVTAYGAFWGIRTPVSLRCRFTKPMQSTTMRRRHHWIFYASSTLKEAYANPKQSLRAFRRNRTFKLQLVYLYLAPDTFIITR